ncbi:MAG: Uma2 family endonuclease [Thermoanaerobaculia bacterium]
MATDPVRRFTPEEYLAFERRSASKSELVHGEIVAMTGASRRHNLIAGNLFAALHAQLRKERGCEAYTTDMRVRIPATNLYTYPDVVVVCGEPRFEDGELDTLLNPTLIAEVLSKSTEDYDRGSKFANYRTLPSFREYLVIAQDRVHVEHHVREAEERWVLTEHDDPGACLELPSIRRTLALADVYDRVFL